jgi:signal transduction histidine kinase
LSEAKEYLINLVNSMPSLIIAVDNELNISIINEVALQFFNLNTNDIINKNISELPILNNYIPEYKESLEKFINIIKDKEPFEFNDKKGFLRITISPLLKFSKGLVIRVDDITENVKLENMMIHNEKMMSLGGLAAGMAHEINNPLGIIIQSIQNIERRLDNKLSKNIKIADEIGIDLDKMYKYLEERQIFVSLDYVEEAALRASNIVQNMLEFSRQGASSFDTYNLENIIDTAISLAKYDIDLKKTFKFKDIVINKNISPEVKSVRCNKTEIEQVILNLLKNASQAMCTISDLDYYPEININSYINDDKLVIEIMDNGPGIKESNIDKIFEPFFTTKDLSEGTGLGLSISYYIITNNHKGKIFAENRPEGGAKFTIILPLN